MTTPSEYILLFRGTDWPKGLSAETTEAVLNRFMDWFKGIEAEGKLKAGQPLERGGKIVSGPNGSSVVDGPFAESKEAVGGYFLIEAADEEEAVAIAKQCPALEFGLKVEVRPVAEECPLVRAHREAKEELAPVAV